MPNIAVVFFAVAAAFGLFLAMRHFRNAELPLPVSLIHGAAAATGLVLLVLTYLQAGEGASALALPLILFVVAALGGFFLFSFHLRGKRAPSAVIVIHALVAICGFLALLFAVL